MRNMKIAKAPDQKEKVINTESTKEARKAFDQFERQIMNSTVPDPVPDRMASLDEVKRVHREKLRRNQLSWRAEDVAIFIDKEIVRQDGLGSIITRGVLKMADQAVTAAEILDKSTEVVENQLAKFNRVCEAALDETKKRVVQLTDYNNRLSVALLNLNKTLGDEKMVRALENADKIASALTLLDALEKKGSLQKIMAALQS